MAKKGGGIRKRAQAVEDAKKESFLALYLLQRWAWGGVSPQEVQHMMALFLLDLNISRVDNASASLSMSFVERLASMGSHGAYPSNISRDINMIVAGGACHMPGPYSFRCPLKHSRAELGVQYQNISMMLPHELFSAMYHHYPGAFRDKLVGPPDALQSFWRAMQETPRLRSHPVRDRPDYMEKCVPISCHGDGTPTVGLGKAWGKLMNIFGWSSLLAHGSTASMYFMSFCIYEGLQTAGVVTGSTLNNFFKRWVWSLLWLFKGVWPLTDVNGKSYPENGPEWQKPVGKPGDTLAGGYYCCLWVITGDLDYFFKVLGLQNYNSNCPCSLCPATSTEMPWFDWRPEALWLRNIYKAGEVPLRNLLFTLPGVSVGTIFPDWMHVKHLGLDKKCYGSILYALIHLVLLDEPAENLRHIACEIQDTYRKLGVTNRYSQMKMRMFFTEKGVVLKGKAQEVKNLGPVLLVIWIKHMNVELRIHRQIRILLELSVRLETIIDDMDVADWRPSSDKSEELIEIGHAYLAMLQSVNDEINTGDSSVELFHVTVKAHFLVHICYLAKYLCPRVAWCYRGEDFMGKIRPLAASCAKGSQPWDVTNKIMDKYRHALHYMLSSA